MEFSPHWKESFMKEREDLERSLGHLALGIHHIGSTAVPGLAAKPVIDIMVATRSIFEVGRFKDKILSLGYLHVPQSDTDRLFFRKGMPRTHHLHIVKLGTWAYYSHLWCRDYLTDHASTAEEYECLKTVLSKHHGSDREAYEQGKEGMIAMILERAVKERMIGLKGCV